MITTFPTPKSGIMVASDKVQHELVTEQTHTLNRIKYIFGFIPPTFGEFVVKVEIETTSTDTGGLATLQLISPVDSSGIGYVLSTVNHLTPLGTEFLTSAITGLALHSSSLSTPYQEYTFSVQRFERSPMYFGIGSNSNVKSIKVRNLRVCYEVKS